MFRGSSPNQGPEPVLPSDGLPNQEKAIVCPGCGLTWFEQVEIQQFDQFNSVVLGQKTAPINPVKFIILRCIKCGELLEPNILYNTMDNIRKAYDKLLTALENTTPVNK